MLHFSISNVAFLMLKLAKIIMFFDISNEKPKSLDTCYIPSLEVGIYFKEYGKVSSLLFVSQQLKHIMTPAYHILQKWKISLDLYLICTC